MKKILLISIHPKFVEKILTGEKRFEFRKHIPSCEISHILIHATTPEKRLVAIAEVEQVLQAPPSVLWEQTKYAAGIPRKKRPRTALGRCEEQQRRELFMKATFGSMAF